MTREIYLIDGSAFIYRAFHAVAPLTNAEGFQTNAVFGFVSMLNKLLKEKSPTHLAVAFDSRGKVFRHEMYPEYKANRPPMPAELAAQLPYIKQVVEALGLVSFEEKGIEADDIIGAAAQALSCEGNKVIIVSGDKDLLQLVDDRITMWDPMNDRVMDSGGVEKKYQVGPPQLLDCFALIGDSSDNVPGVPGIGPKTAAKLIVEYGSLEGLYEQVEGLKKSKMKERLIDNREAAFMSRDLIRLKTDVTVPLSPEGYTLGEKDEETLRRIYSELGFTSLLRELDGSARAIPTGDFHSVNDSEELKKLTALLHDAPVLVVDTETTSLQSRNAELVGISLNGGGGECWYIPVGHRDQEGRLIASQLPLDLVKEELSPLLEADTLPKLAHNLKYDYSVLKHGLGVELKGQLLDTMIGAYLVEPSRRSFKLDDLCLELGFKLTSYKEVTGGDKREDAFAYVDMARAAHYSCEDVFATLQLWNHYQPLLEERDQEELFTEVEMKLVPILERMEADGIRIDPVHLKKLSNEFRRKLDQREKEIYELAGHEFNINSPQQLGTVLFEELGLPYGRKTKTGYSTDIKVLEKLAPQHELPALIIDYRNLAKLLSTYVDKLAQMIDPGTGRVHTSFNQTVTATGRLSSSNPNLQNIPIRGEEGARIREAFVPAAGKVFLFGDYSQIDLRVLAHYSQDPALIKAFREGDDIHTRTAAEVFSVAPLLVTSEMRRVAKSINFGIVYGMSSFGLSNQLQISRREASLFIDRYFNLYRGVKQFMEEIVEQAKKDGYVTTLLNRRRYLPEIDASNKVRREFAERAALNTPIQGTAADIIKLAMLRVDELLKQRRSSCRMLLQIHDELVFELAPEECDELQPQIQQTMEQAMKLDVPLVVNMERGTNLAK
jgi:DNA polymerase I